MKNLIKLVFAAGLFSCVQAAIATDLLEVYHHALESDQTYKQAEATYLSAKTTVDQSQANLLPNLQLTGAWTETKNTANVDPNYIGASSGTSNSAVTALSLNLTQTLFNWQQFKSLQEVKTTVKAAATTYAAAAQDLIMRVSTAYFAVLQL